MRTHLLLLLLLVFSMGNAQQIMFSSDPYSEGESLVTENQHWNSFEVLAEGFALNPEITITKNVDNRSSQMQVAKLHATQKGKAEDYTLNRREGVECYFDCPEDISVEADPGANSAIVEYELDFSCETIIGECEIDYPLQSTSQDNNNHAISTNYAGISWIIANDFDVPEGQIISVTKFIPTLIFPSVEGDIYFYEDNNGVPGTLIVSFQDVELNSSSIIDGNINEAIYILPEIVELTSGKYWVGFHTEMLDPPSIYYSVYWATNPTLAPGGFHAWRSGDNGLTWNTSGNMQIADGVFKIAYECSTNPTEDVEVVLIEGYPSGSAFPIGTTTITHNLVYDGEVIDICSFDVIVQGTPPTGCSITCPDDITTEAKPGATTAVVEYEIDFECAAGGEFAELELVEGLPSGSEFPIGTTTVSYNLVFDEEILDNCTFTVTVNKATSIDIDDLDDITFHYFPNPFTNILNLAFSKEMSSVSIYDYLGRRIYLQNINDKNAQLDLSTLASGTYIIQVQIDQGLKSFQIIKK